VNGLPGVLVEGLGDPAVLPVVPPYELLVPPLPLRAVAEEEDGGMVAERVDGQRKKRTGKRVGRPKERGGPSVRRQVDD